MAACLRCRQDGGRGHRCGPDIGHLGKTDLAQHRGLIIDPPFVDDLASL